MDSYFRGGKLFVYVEHRPKALVTKVSNVPHVQLFDANDFQFMEIPVFVFLRYTLVLIKLLLHISRTYKN